MEMNLFCDLLKIGMTHVQILQLLLCITRHVFISNSIKFFSLGIRIISHPSLEVESLSSFDKFIVLRNVL